jgi:predicted transglutaminase-like cysteine proteinase
MARGRNRLLAGITAIIALAVFCTYSTFAVLGRGFNFDHQIQLAGQRYGAHGRQTIEQWSNLLQSLQGSGRSEQVRQVNDFVNKHLTYTEDNEAWGVDDYWATPLESLGRGVGDCEDYAIAKYFSLLILGVPVDNLRITYVRAQTGSPNNPNFIAHMVLAYYPTVESEPLILDNLVGNVLPASQRSDLYPIFGFNSAGLWVGAAKSSSGSSTAQLSHWRDTLARMHADGFE